MSDELETFEIGDLVQVKSGGPAMTVQEISHMTGEYQCVWFNGNIKQQSSFDGEVLKVYEPPSDENDEDKMLEKYLDGPAWTPPKSK